MELSLIQCSVEQQTVGFTSLIPLTGVLVLPALIIMHVILYFNTYMWWNNRQPCLKTRVLLDLVITGACRSLCYTRFPVRTKYNRFNFYFLVLDRYTYKSIKFKLSLLVVL